MDTIHLVDSQKCCYFTALRGIGVINNKFYKKWGIIEKKHFNYENNKFIEMEMTSSIQYYPTEKENILSNGQYAYSIIIIECIDLNITLVGFPLKIIAQKLIDSFVDKEINVLSKSNFVKVDMSRLISVEDDYTEIIYYGNRFVFGGVFLSLSGDSYITTVRLIGEKPLESEIYQGYFKTRLEDLGIEKIILKCGRINNKSKGIIKKYASSVHIDKSGNYKFYIQKNGSNLFTIITIFNMLDHFKCFEDKPNKPIIKVDENE